MTAEPFDRAAAGRAAIERRWAPYRATRIAQGLAPTKQAERGTKPDRFDDPEVEAFWMGRAEEMGIYPANAGRTQKRRIAHRLAEAETKAIIEAAGDTTTTGVPSDADTLIAYHEQEIARLTAQRSAELRRAAEHARLIADHETALVEAIRREGRA
jgi:hypothetical protein